MTKGSPREWLFGNVVETKVVEDDESSYFKLFPDVHDHLGDLKFPSAREASIAQRCE